MAETTTLDQQQQRTGNGELDARLARQVEAVLEAAERSRPEQEPVPGHWFFRVPQAGVRYYAF